ncbi:MAG: PQQ-binding-like beta-propeller repeat protein [Acidobacteria bacterium]|nr:PQQ-binding-like beta-propeller repeat protein [Acidobacteriota bacterium]MDA1235225.1 PQQ-binding-like beta-propeller repeat protein [Acidobacteriota bacterium]
MSRATLMGLAPLYLIASSLFAQQGATDGDWRFYGGDAGTTKYASLDQINEENVGELEIVWRWKSENFGPRPDYNWEVTPLSIGGTLYFTAGTRRDVIAVDGATGETLWMYRIDEGVRGDRAVRPQNRGLAYWTDGQGAERILLITPGFQLVALDAKTGMPVEDFGKEGIVELTEGLDRDVVEPGQIGSSSPAIVVGNVVVVGAALAAGTAPRSKENVPGYIRGYHVRTGERLWTFKTIPQEGEFGNETWENESWKYTGNTGAWAPLSADLELGYVYIPVEMPTGDFYGGNRPGDNLFGDSLVCLDAKTGERVWHFQAVHHDVWDYDLASPPILANVTIDGRPRKIVAQPSKQGMLYVLDRVTGEPIWPIVERPVPQSDVPGETMSATQPFPTKPAPYEPLGSEDGNLIDLTPELRAEAIEIARQYRQGPVFTPPIVPDTDGKAATLVLPNHTGGSNWPGGALDAETGIAYIASITREDPLAVAVADPSRSDMSYVGTFSRAGGPPRGGRRNPLARNLGPQGLPLHKTPWGRITAIDLNTGEHLWVIPNGEPPDYIKEHPALQGVDLTNVGNPERSHIIVTKTLLLGGVGAGMFNAGTLAGTNEFRAINKTTGEVIHKMELPAGTTGIPMTYMANGRQYIVVAVGGRGVPAELVALATP